MGLDDSAGMVEGRSEAVGRAKRCWPMKRGALVAEGRGNMNYG